MYVCKYREDACTCGVECIHHGLTFVFSDLSVVAHANLSFSASRYFSCTGMGECPGVKGGVRVRSEGR